VPRPSQQQGGRHHAETGWQSDVGYALSAECPAAYWWVRDDGGSSDHRQPGQYQRKGIDHPELRSEENGEGDRYRAGRIAFDKKTMFTPHSARSRSSATQPHRGVVIILVLGIIAITLAIGYSLSIV